VHHGLASASRPGRIDVTVHVDAPMLCIDVRDSGADLPSGRRGIGLGIGAGRPEPLFLDVQMPELDGFGVLRAVLDVRVPAVVFVTAFDEHAVGAFDEEATDYRMKPFDDDRFGPALDWARARIEATRRESSPEPGPSRWVERFAVDCAGRISIIPVDTIQWIGAQDYDV